MRLTVSSSRARAAVALKLLKDLVYVASTLAPFFMHGHGRILQGWVLADYVTEIQRRESCIYVQCSVAINDNCAS